MSNEHQSGTPTEAPVTDDLMQQLADEAEVGYDVAVLRRHRGRRPLESGPAEVMPVRPDPELRACWPPGLTRSTPAPVM